MKNSKQFKIEHKCEAQRTADGKNIICNLCNKNWSATPNKKVNIICRGWSLLEKVSEKKFQKYVANDGNRSIKYEKRKGDPDQLIFISPCYFFFIEFKRKGEQLSPLQIEKHKDLLGAGYAVYTTSSLKEAIEIYNSEKAHFAQISKKGC